MDAASLGAIVANCRDFVGIATGDGRVLYVNPYGREMLGLAGEAAAVPVEDYYSDETLAVLVEEALPAVAEHGGWQGRTVWHHLETGEPIPVHQSIFPLPHFDAEDDAGAVYATIARDLREIEATEAALRASERRWRDLFEHAPIGFAVTDTEGRFVEVNARLCAILGRSADDLRGLTFAELTHPDDVDISTSALNRLLDGEQGGFSYQKRYRRTDGGYVWVQVTPTALHDGAGDVVGAMATLQDVTEQRRRAEEARQQREQELISAHVGQLHELSVAAVAITASLSLGEAIRETARRARQIVGAHLAVVSLADGEAGGEAGGEADGPPTAVDRSGKYGAYTDRQLAESVLHEDGSVPLRGLLAVPLLGREGGELGEISLSDAQSGDFDDGDEAILRQLAQLAAAAVERTQLLGEQAEHRAAAFRDDLLAGITHDMQTPLTTILGVVDLLEDHLSGDHLRAAEALRRQARRLRSLVQQFLDFSRLEAGHPLDVRREPVRPADILREAAELFAPHQRITAEVPSELPRIVADPDRLIQVLSNLLANAIRYTDGEITVTASADTDHLRIDVADRGPGIPEEQGETIFERFTRGDGPSGGGGTGLGLYIARALADAQGGTLTVHDREGGGSVFRLTLPTATAEG